MKNKIFIAIALSMPLLPGLVFANSAHQESLTQERNYQNLEQLIIHQHETYENLKQKLQTIETQSSTIESQLKRYTAQHQALERQLKSQYQHREHIKGSISKLSSDKAMLKLQLESQQRRQEHIERNLAALERADRSAEYNSRIEELKRNQAMLRAQRSKQVAAQYSSQSARELSGNDRLADNGAQDAPALAENKIEQSEAPRVEREVKRAARGLDIVTSAVRSLYDRSSEYNGLSEPVIIQSGAIPRNMFKGEPGTASADIVSAWGDISIKPISADKKAPGPRRLDSFSVTFEAIPDHVCSKFIAKAMSDGDELIKVTVDDREVRTTQHAELACSVRGSKVEFTYN